MKAVTTKDVTQLLRAWGRGDADARDQLYRLVYDELHRLAHQHDPAKIRDTPYKPLH